MSTKLILLTSFVLVVGLAVEVANADFTFGTPTNLGPTINSSLGDWPPSISADGLTLYFGSYNRPGGYGKWDLWVATRETADAEWGTPANLGPTVNSFTKESGPSISADRLSLFFHSDRRGGVGPYGTVDIWVTTRATTGDPWAEPVNLGPTVNSSDREAVPSISADGLSLFFVSDRPGGFGETDLYVATRDTIDGEWSTPANLGPTVNTLYADAGPNISGDGLSFFFHSPRPGGSGRNDIWVTRRATTGDPWAEPVNLGPTVNSSDRDVTPFISADGSTLFFTSDRPGGYGGWDIWQAPIIPIVDFNGDGIVDAADMSIMIDHWGTDESLCDIGPMPWGDGIVDVQDLIVLAEHLFEKFPPVEPKEVNVDEEYDGGQIELEQGQILVVTLESNPTTGYRWEQAENQESILEQMGEAEFKPSETGEPPLVGAGGWEIFRFKAISAGQMTLQLVYHRSWEEGVEPLKTFSIQVVVR